MHVRGQLADGEVQLVEREVHRVEGVGGGEDLEQALLLLLELLEQVPPQLVQPISSAGEVTLAVWLGCVTSIVVELGASAVSGDGSSGTFLAATYSDHRRQEARRERASGPATARRAQRRLLALRAAPRRT